MIHSPLKGWVGVLESGDYTIEKCCSECNGDGKISGNPVCTECKGTGKPLPSEEYLMIDILKLNKNLNSLKEASINEKPIALPMDEDGRCWDSWFRIVEKSVALVEDGGLFPKEMLSDKDIMYFDLGKKDDDIFLAKVSAAQGLLDKLEDTFCIYNEDTDDDYRVGFSRTTDNVFLDRLKKIYFGSAAPAKLPVLPKDNIDTLTGGTEAAPPYTKGGRRRVIVNKFRTRPGDPPVLVRILREIEKANGMVSYDAI